MVLEGLPVESLLLRKFECCHFERSPRKSREDGYSKLLCMYSCVIE